MASENPLLGVCLVGEAETSSDNVITALYVPSSARNQTLNAFRSTLLSSLPQSLASCGFVFLTARGWEINEGMEGTVRLCDVVTEDGLVKIRRTFVTPKVGIIVEGSPDMAVGFVFCSVNSSVAQFQESLMKQLPNLHRSFQDVGFCLLDQNGWPIAREQEGLLSLFDIVSSSSVRVRCFTKRHASLPPEVSSVSMPFQTTSLSVSTAGGIFNSGGPKFDSQTSLPPPMVSEVMEQVDSTNLEKSWTAKDKSGYKASIEGTYSFDILLSYVHSEAADHALVLKEALEKLNFKVFLDVHCIQGGTDWQDVLNDAITNCSLFVPLITLQYGQTLWTNREVKLADVLGKMILPISLLSYWPPKCLAIQFATTQYIPWAKAVKMLIDSRLDMDGEIEAEEVDPERALKIAQDIASRYEREIESSGRLTSSESSAIADEESESQSTEILEEIEPNFLQLPPSLLRKKSSIKSYASTLPKSIPMQYRNSIYESREGKPLLVISCHEKQREHAQELTKELEAKDFEVWCSCDVKGADEEEDRATFQFKINEAGAVVFLLSKEFSTCSFCEQQVYYCEQRKVIIPLLCEPIEIPLWMSTLIGTNTFIDAKAQGYKATLISQVTKVLSPIYAEQQMKELSRQKAQLANLCSELSEKLPKGSCVYMSGGTKFFSKCGEEICKEIGKRLAENPELVLVTGGFYGVGETVGRSFHDARVARGEHHGVCHVVAEKDEQDKSNQTRQNPDGTFQVVPYGETLFICESVRQREMLTPKVIPVCILVEGGPGAAFEAQQFVWNGNQVIPIKVTGGAAGGKFNVPQTIFQKPSNVKDSDWACLSNEQASAAEIAGAVFHIVSTVTSSYSSPRSRSNTGNAASQMQRPRGILRRSETLPGVKILPPSSGGGDGGSAETSTMKRAFSEMDSPPLPSFSRQKTMMI